MSTLISKARTAAQEMITASARRIIHAVGRLRDSDVSIIERLVAEWQPDTGPLLLLVRVDAAEHWVRLLAKHRVHTPQILLSGTAPGQGRFSDPTDLEDALALLPAAGAILDVVAGTPTEEYDRWIHTLAHVKAGGILTMISAANRARFTSPWAEGVISPEIPQKTSAIATELRTAFGHRAITARTLTFTKSRPHYRAVVEADAEAVLPHRNPALRVRTLATLPPADYQHRSRITQHETGIDLPRFETDFHAPERRLRHYEGHLRWISHMLVTHEQTFLPPSFRFPDSNNLDAPVAKRLSARTFSLPEQFEKVSEHLQGPFYDLSGGWPSHFGHFMQQSVSKLWGWDAAKSEIPELKALVQIRMAKGHAFQEQILTAYGISPEDIVWIDERVALRSLVSSATLFQMHPPAFIHPHQLETWKRLGDALIDETIPQQKKIFVSRRPDFAGRSCKNLPDVEALFAEHGFDLYYPEDHTISHQASTFAGAEVVAGLGGSAMFNLGYARSLRTLIVLNHESYTARNEHLVSAFQEWDVHYFWSPADVQHPPRGWSVAAYQSAWSFDFQRNATALRDLLNTL